MPQRAAMRTGSSAIAMSAASPIVELRDRFGRSGTCVWIGAECVHERSCDARPLGRMDIDGDAVGQIADDAREQLEVAARLAYGPERRAKVTGRFGLVEDPERPLLEAPDLVEEAIGACDLRGLRGLRERRGEMRLDVAPHRGLDEPETGGHGAVGHAFHERLIDSLAVVVRADCTGSGHRPLMPRSVPSAFAPSWRA